MKKDWRNKVYNLRSQSVAKQIKDAQQERQITNNKMSHIRRKQGSVTSVRSKMQFKLPKNHAALEFLDQPLNSLEVRASPGQYKTLNSTHGPFHQKGNLPPLSALQKYDRSTKASDTHQMLGAQIPPQRANTNMEVRHTSTADANNRMYVRSSLPDATHALEGLAVTNPATRDQPRRQPLKGGEDPFYSSDMAPYNKQLQERQGGFGVASMTLTHPSTPAEEMVVVEEGKAPNLHSSFRHNSLGASDMN